MSYILDALRRADSERERGSIPDIHAQPVPPGLDDGDGEARPAYRPLIWVIVGLAVALVLSLLWQMRGRDDAPSDVAIVAAAPAVAPPAPAPAEPVQAQLSQRDTMVPAVADATPAATSVLVPAPSKALAVRLPSAAPLPAPVATQRTTAQPPTTPVPTAAPPHIEPPTAKTEPSGSETAAESRVYARHELPEQIRRELPALTISGSVYSPSPASRMLIINGMVFHEGDKPAPELQLEQIKLKAAVFKYKGYRYEVGY